MSFKELEGKSIFGGTQLIGVESPFLPETSHVKEMEIGCLPEMRKALEKLTLAGYFSSEGLREVLGGMTVSFVLEHVPRLVHDTVTIDKDVYSAQSWRYPLVHIKEDDAKGIHPPECLRGNVEFEERFSELASLSIKAYKRMIDRGIPREDARYVCLWSFDSNIIVTLQGPKLVDFAIHNLNSPYQVMRAVANEMITIFGQKFPVTAGNLREVAMKEGISWEERLRIEEMREQSLYRLDDEVVVYSYSEDPIKKAAVAAKTCYHELPPSEFINKFSKEAQQRRLGEILASGHTSVVEHPHFLILFSISEANGQQIRRHRIPVQRAMAMWLAAKEYQIVIPPSIQSDKEALRLYLEVWNKSKTFIKEAIQAGFPAPELDHAVIVGIKVPFFLVTNSTDLLHIGKRRLCQRAQWETREWMYNVAEVLIKNWPLLFKDLATNCHQGKCTEGKMSCGHPEIYRDWRKNIS